MKSDFSFEREADRITLVVNLASAAPDEKQRLIEEYEKRSEAAFSPSTLRNYRQIRSIFVRWCQERGVNHVPPIAPQVIAEYIEDMGGKLKCSTIETRLWAISEMHRAAFEPSPCRNRLVELALKGVKRRYGAFVRQAAPLSKKEVMDVIRRLGNSRLDLRDKALLWIASDSWCRSSEIVAFKVRDVHRQLDGTSLLHVTRSKTDPFGEGAFAFLSAAGTRAVLEWIEVAELKADDPLLTKSQVNGAKTPLDTATISRIMRRCTAREDISAHSTRVGGVQDAFRLGCDLSSIMVAGRWSSPEMPARYGRRILASQSAAAQVSAAFSEEE